VALDAAALRAAELPWTARGETIYLNNASTGPLPERAVREQREWAARRAEPWRISDEEELAVMRRARAAAARLVGARPEEIALTTNTSHGINLAARALPLGAGDVVHTFDREFPANVYPWMALAPRGVRLERIPCRGALPDEEALLAAIERPGVKVVTVSWVSFATGYRVDLARIGRACREHGVRFVVDAIQGVGVAALDVHACGIDILACGAQKWMLGPWGAGFAYVRAELARELDPPVVGWLSMRGAEDFTRLVDYDFTYVEEARRFEVGTLPYQELAAMSASAELLAELGVERIECHVRGLVDRVVAWADAHPGVELVTPREPARRAGIVAVRPAGDARAASARLTSAGVAHALREGAIRLSPHWYNTAEEIERALELLAG
jgi:selenocysteine lyase/cysteine desulfurase